MIFENQENKNKSQLLAELALKKLCEDLLMKNSIFEYVNKEENKKVLFMKMKKMVSRFIMKTGFVFSGKSEDWGELMRERRVEVDIVLEYDDGNIE